MGGVLGGGVGGKEGGGGEGSAGGGEGGGMGGGGDGLAGGRLGGGRGGGEKCRHTQAHACSPLACGPRFLASGCAMSHCDKKQPETPSLVPM